MTHEIEIYGALCATSVFTVNGIRADSDDFGESEDADRDNAPEYGCGNRVFEPSPPRLEILEKYGITEAEYEEIAEKLAAGLSFGCCGWCI